MNSDELKEIMEIGKEQLEHYKTMDRKIMLAILEFVESVEGNESKHPMAIAGLKTISDKILQLIANTEKELKESRN